MDERQVLVAREYFAVKGVVKAPFCGKSRLKKCPTPPKVCPTSLEDV
jgi:hypothetical protein